MDDAWPPRRAARELDRSLHRLRPGIGEEHFVEIRHIFQEALGQHTRKRRDVELHQVGQIAVKHAFQRRAQGRMVPADRKDAKSAQ